MFIAETFTGEHIDVLLLLYVKNANNLQNKNRLDLLTFYKFAVPVFHSYGHKVECQVLQLAM